MAKRSDSFLGRACFSRLTVLQNANVESEREFPPPKRACILEAVSFLLIAVR